MRNILYPAIITKTDEGISARLPDFPGCAITAPNMNFAHNMANQILLVCLTEAARKKVAFPQPSIIATLPLEKNECVIMLHCRPERVNNPQVYEPVQTPEWLETFFSTPHENLNTELRLEIERHPKDNV